MKFRYNASWQGDITWLEGEQTESFESLLQMLQLIDRIFTGQSEMEKDIKITRVCQIAVNSSEKGLLIGRYRTQLLIVWRSLRERLAWQMQWYVCLRQEREIMIPEKSSQRKHGIPIV